MVVFVGDDIDSRRAFPRPGGSHYTEVSDRLPRPILMIESAAEVEQFADWLRWGLVQCLTECVHQREKVSVNGDFAINLGFPFTG